MCLAAEPDFYRVRQAVAWESDTAMLSLRSATLELTHRCNLRCLHCFNDSGLGESIDMEIGNLDCLLDELSRHPGIEIYLSGGEPTLHPEFDQILEMMAQREMTFIVCTNGILSEESITTLSRPKSLPKRVHVSLEGMEPENDAIRGRGTFQRIVEHTIPALRSQGNHVCVAIHLTKDNSSSIPELCRLLIDQLDCDVKFGVLRPVGRAQGQLVEKMLSPAELQECIGLLQTIKTHYARKRIWHDWDIYTEDVKFYSQDYKDKTSCLAGQMVILAVTPDFHILPCVQLRGPEFVLGTFQKPGDLERLMSSDKARGIQDRFQTKPEVCHVCQYFGRTCQGGCPAVSYGLHGTLESLTYCDPYCICQEEGDMAI